VTWHGRYNKGAMRARRVERRDEAEARDADCPDTRRRRHRLAAYRLTEAKAS
jgi:hypothetical protein